MNCPKCGTQSSVSETRRIALGTRRRRHCPNTGCMHRFTTAEIQLPEGCVIPRGSRIFVLSQEQLKSISALVECVGSLPALWPNGEPGEEGAS